MANVAQEKEAGKPRFLLPGLHVPIDYIPDTTPKQYNPYSSEKEALFPNALTPLDEHDESCGRMTTLREFIMLQIMDSLSDKKGWEDKVFDDTIANKWKEELLAMPETNISQKMADFIIDELRYRAPFFKKNGMYVVYDGSVVKSDIAVPAALRDALRAEVKCLEDVPEHLKDYHPGSDGKVIDLVHPSLFPLIYGRSKAIATGAISKENAIASIGSGKVVPKIEERFGSEYSTRFQWLPCDLEFRNEGNDIEITSYINNLHPEKHGDLYKVIEKIISCSIPLWNMTLSHARYFSERDTYERITYVDVDQSYPEERRPQQADDEDEDDYMDRVSEWEQQEAIILQPEPGKFKPPQGFSFYLEGKDEWKEENIEDLRRDFHKSGLQVIVKLATIELTPEKPEYTGGTWHVEGQLNEHICATALYYYESTNITESRLSFRQRCENETATTEINYPQSEHQFLTQVFGCESDEAAVQEIGSVNCLEGRLLTFPNLLQHRVQPFKLADATKPGVRKILALFLVDPNIRVISTANVPPQQKEWWAEELLKRGELHSLSRELQDQIFDKVDDFPIGLKEAKEIRQELMDERKSFVVEANEAFKSLTFSLCEH